MKYFFFVIVFFITGLTHAQLITAGGISPNNLVQNVLVGQGVEVSNVTYSGSAGAIGRFSGNSSIGLTEGIILTTGTINSGPQGPYGPNNKPNAGIDNNAGGFAPLGAIVGNANTYNAAVLSFDFIPQSDTVRFEYVFGSEEYPEWVGYQFNDVFAFFISGPGIDGTKNMALIPGTTQAVAINNVNNGLDNNGACTNCQYYVNNGTGNNPPFNSNSYYVQYDGFTTPLEAVSEVECGKKYRLTIAIADVGDPIFDSGIFLAANSLSSTQTVNATYSISRNYFNSNNTLAQGCTSATVNVRRAGKKISEPEAIPVSISGSAVQGIDYSNIPAVLNFNAGQTELSFSFDALYNPNLTEPVNLVLVLTFLDACENETTHRLEFVIMPTPKLAVELNNREVLCSGDALILKPTVTGGQGSYFYEWNTGSTQPQITVNPTETTNYSVSVRDECLNEVVTVENEVFVPIYDPIELTITDDITIDCPYVPQTISSSVTGGAGNYSYKWADNHGESYADTPEIDVKPHLTTTYYLTVTDQCGESSIIQMTIEILSPPLVLSISPDLRVCPFDSVELIVQASGGLGEYSYRWVHSDETTPTVWVQPDTTTTYQVIVQDECLTFDVRASTTITVQKPTALFEMITEPPFINLPMTFQNLSFNGLYYEWDFGDGNFSTHTHPNNTYSVPGNYEVMLIAIDELGCRDTTYNWIRMKEEFYLYVPNTFTPGISSRPNQVFSVSAINITQFDISIYNRWGELVFSSDDVNFKWDGTFNGRPLKDGTYIWEINYVSINDDEETIHGHVNVLR